MGSGCSKDCSAEDAVTCIIELENKMGIKPPTEEEIQSVINNAIKAIENERKMREEMQNLQIRLKELKKT